MLGGLTWRHCASVIIERLRRDGMGRGEGREEGGVDDGVTGWPVEWNDDV